MLADRQIEVLALAREAGFPEWWLRPPEPERQGGEALALLERFARLYMQRRKSTQ